VSRPEYILIDYENAPSGVGPLAEEWKDKPHLLLYDLIDMLRRQEVPKPEERIKIQPAKSVFESCVVTVDGVAEAVFQKRTNAETYVKERLLQLKREQEENQFIAKSVQSFQEILNIKKDASK
jgi:hypothetical protein